MALNDQKIERVHRLLEIRDQQSGEVSILGQWPRLGSPNTDAFEHALAGALSAHVLAVDHQRFAVRTKDYKTLYLTAEQVLRLGLARAEMARRCMPNYEKLRAQIFSATTEEQLAAINLAIGWPEGIDAYDAELTDS